MSSLAIAHLQIEVKQDTVSDRSTSTHLQYELSSGNHDLHHHIQVRLLSFTHNGGLSHSRYAFCCAQARLCSHSSMSKCHIIRVKIDRISKYARLNWQSSAYQALLLLKSLRTYFLPRQFRGPTENGWSASLRSLR